MAIFQQPNSTLEEAETASVAQARVSEAAYGMEARTVRDDHMDCMLFVPPTAES